MRTWTAVALLAAGLLPAQEATLARRPYLQNVRAESAVVMWTTTRAPGAGSVRYGEGAATANIVRSVVEELRPAVTGLGVTIYQHRARLTGLRAGARYRYQVLVDGRDVLASEALQFETPSPDGAFEFLVFGDSGDGGQPQLALAERMLRERPQLVLHTGDIAYVDGSYRAFEDYYFDVYGPLLRRAPIFPVPGNHDYGTGNAAPYLSVHDVPGEGVPPSGRGRYYSFDWGNAHFVALDSNDPMRDAIDGNGPMLEWLAADLAATRQAFRIVYFHHTAFPTAAYLGNSYCDGIRSALTGLLERHGVQLVLMGHEHLYQRTKTHRGGQFLEKTAGIVYVTTGGAGSNIYAPSERSFLNAGAGVPHFLRARVTGRTLTLEAIGADSAVLDRFSISAGPVAEAAVDAAAGRPLLAPGGLASLFGWTLAPGLAVAGGYPLPRDLAGVSVKVGGQPAPLLFVSRSQVNLQVPYGLAPGETSISVTHDGVTSTLAAVLRAFAPAIFQAGGRPAITHADGGLVSPAAPARPGEWLVVYLTGLGEASGASDGQPAGAPSVTQPVRVELDGVECEVAYAGLAPGLAGVNQINWRVPAAAAPGTPVLRVSDPAGTTSITAAVAVGL